MYQANGTYYTEEHSISFGEIMLDNSTNLSVFEVLANTWEDWHLIPSSRPSIVPPPVVTKYIEIPGSDGVIDLSEYLTGKATYGARNGSLSFVVDNDHESWETIRQNMINYLHGKKVKMRLEDDPYYFYEGRFTVGNWESGADHSSISITYNLDPFKYRIEATGSDYPTLWDPFNFETDYDYSVLSPNVTVNNNTKTFNIYSGDYPFAPSAIWVSGTTTVSFGGVTKTISSSLRSAELGKSTYGANILSVSGIGSVKINWRGGSL